MDSDCQLSGQKLAYVVFEIKESRRKGTLKNHMHTYSMFLASQDYRKKEKPLLGEVDHFELGKPLNTGKQGEQGLSFFRVPLFFWWFDKRHHVVP